MSVIVWKDGASSMCEPRHLKNLLDAGYSLSKDIPKPPNNNSELRLKAKKLGIKSYHNKKPENLQKEINEIQNDSD